MIIEMVVRYDPAKEPEPSLLDRFMSAHLSRQNIKIGDDEFLVEQAKGSLGFGGEVFTEFRLTGIRK